MRNIFRSIFAGLLMGSNLFQLNAAEPPARKSPPPPVEKIVDPAPTNTGDYVEYIVICSGVESREPVDELTTVNSSVGSVFCWIKVIMDPVPSRIKHVWYRDGKKVADIALKVNTNPCRTWSGRIIEPGKWKVEVVKENGEMLAEKEFTVVK